MGSEWRTVRLGDHVHACLGKMLDKEKNRGEFLPYLGNKNVRWGSFDTEDLPQMRFEEHEHERYELKRGDLVVCEGGEPGRCAIWKAEIPGMKIQKALHRIRPLDGLDNTYLHYWFLWSGRNGSLEPFFTGTTIKHLTGKAIAELKIPLPPLLEQRAIAHTLGTLDDKIELNRRMNETLEAMAQALFRSWFVDFDPVIDKALAAGHPIPESLHKRAEARQTLGEKQKPLPSSIAQHFPDQFVFNEEMGWVPEGWEQTTFGEASHCFDRKRIPLSKVQREEKKPGLIPYYGATSVMDYINEWIFDDIYLLIGEDGSVIKEDETPFVQYIWGKSWVNNHAHVLQGAAGLATEHLMLFMSHQNMSAYVTGAVQLKINQQNMRRIPFLKASHELNAGFGEMISPYYAKIRQHSEASTNLTSLRDTLLPKLLSGELRLSAASLEELATQAGIPDAEKLIEEAL